jgi:hypothetical protein
MRMAIRRRLSDTTVDPAEEKAQARLMKIGFVAVPLILLGGLSSFTVHSPNVREIVDEYFPNYGTSLILLN